MPEHTMDEVLDPVYVAGLPKLSLPDLRAKRDRCSELETELSYLRRLTQARIDLITAESDRRQRGLAAPGPEVLVEQLAHILGEHARGEGPGRLPVLLAPSEGVQERLAARVEAICSSDQLGSLGELSSSQLEELLANLSSLERDVSAERRALHGVQDKLQEELVRRYRSGEATVDALLT
ncbi:MAG: aerial mycelium formation protein [Actinomycetota bacterium]|nr:aerial mycelium formation protein [Actinomycetota bacterium]